MIHFFNHYKDVILVWLFTVPAISIKQVNEGLTTMSLLLAISFTIYKFFKNKE